MKSNESVGQNLSQQLVYYLMAQIEQNIQRSGSNLIDESFTEPSLVTLFPKIDCGLYGLLWGLHCLLTKKPADNGSW